MENSKCGLPLVSIIIPAYNAELYLEECLTSVVGQSYPNLEIIVENDGSVDATSAICHQWQSDNPSILVFEHENWGVSQSRNHALKHASGKYVSFVDADDIIQQNFISTLAEMMEEYQVDCAAVQCMCGQRYNEMDSSAGSVGILEGRECMSLLFSEYQGFLCNKIYRRDFILNNNLQLNPNVSMTEDLLFNTYYFQFCRKVAFCDSPLYFYRQQEKSAVYNLANASWFDCIKSYEQILQILRQYNYDKSNVVYSKAGYEYCNFLIQGLYRIQFIEPRYQAEYRNLLLKKLHGFKFKEYHWTLKQKLKLLLTWLFPSAVLKYRRRRLA